MAEQENLPENPEEARKKELDKRLDAIGWGLFLLMIVGANILIKSLLRKT